MKLAGAVLVLFAGYLVSRYLIRPHCHHLMLLEEGEYLFRILESEVRDARTPLPALFEATAKRSHTEWQTFFQALAAALYNEQDFIFEREYERLLSSHMKNILTPEEELLFIRAGQSLLSPDMIFQRKNVEQLSEELKVHITKHRENLKNQKKVYQALCLCVSALIVIILI